MAVWTTWRIESWKLVNFLLKSESSWSILSIISSYLFWGTTIRWELAVAFSWIILIWVFDFSVEDSAIEALELAQLLFLFSLSDFRRYEFDVRGSQKLMLLWLRPLCVNNDVSLVFSIRLVWLLSLLYISKGRSIYLIVYMWSIGSMTLDLILVIINIVFLNDAVNLRLDILSFNNRYSSPVANPTVNRVRVAPGISIFWESSAFADF